MLTKQGELAGKRVSEFQGQQRVQLQFIEKKADGSLGFMEVKVPEGIDHEQYKIGARVTVPVEYKLVKDKIYWAVTKEGPRTGA